MHVPTLKKPIITTESLDLRVSDISHLIAPLEFNSTFPGTPMPLCKVPAGFPSPADDYIERHLDLNSEYIKHPSATFLVKAAGESMTEAGIFDGDVLIVDRSLTPYHGNIVIADINGELKVKRLSYQKERVQLLPANPHYKPIDITEEVQWVIWGVVTLVLHRPS